MNKKPINKLLDAIKEEIQYTVKMGDIAIKPHLKAFWHGQEHGLERARKIIKKIGKEI